MKRAQVRNGNAGFASFFSKYSVPLMQSSLMACNTGFLTGDPPRRSAGQESGGTS